MTEAQPFAKRPKPQHLRHHEYQESLVLTRRQLFKLAGLGTVSLGAMGLLWGWPLAERGLERLPKPIETWHFLTRQRAEIILALLPIMLEGALPNDAQRPALERKMLQYIDFVCWNLSPEHAANLEKLFLLLETAPFRRWIVWVRRPWLKAETAQLEAFLQRWRFGNMQSIRIAYQYLREIIFQAWYSDPQSWTALGFSGLPKVNYSKAMHHKNADKHKK